MTHRRRPTAGLLGGSALLALLLAPAAIAQQDRPAQPEQPQDPAATELDPERPAQAEDAPPADPPQEVQDRQLAESMDDELPPNQGGRRRGTAMMIPEGWARIAIDYNGDGRVDAVETIYTADLIMARNRSVQRRQGGNVGQGARGGQAMGSPDRSGPQSTELSGTIREIREFNLAGFDQPHKIARVETGEGRVAKVDFGPTDQLQNVNLQQGDEVTVRGRRGMINDRPLLMAQEITKGQQTATIRRPSDRMLKRVRGQVQGTREANFRGRREPHVIARVNLRGGRTAPIILGPKSKVSNLNLSEGDSVAMLVRPGRLNGRLAMIAEQIRSGDQTIEIRDPVERRARTESGSSGSGGGQGQSPTSGEARSNSPSGGGAPPPPRPPEAPGSGR